MPVKQKKPGLPDTKATWEKRVKKLGIWPASVHTAKPLTRASEIKEKEFYRLHVLWKHSPIPKFDWTLAGLAEWKNEAKILLRGYKCWQEYCNSLQTKEICESTFALALAFQRQAAGIDTNITRPDVEAGPPRYPTRQARKPRITPMDMLTERTGRLNIQASSAKEEGADDEDVFLSTPVRIREQQFNDTPISLDSPGDPELRRTIYPPTKDEQIVNTALLNFLTALTIHMKLSVQWSLHRVPLHADFNTASYEARTDGYLESIEESEKDKKIRALIEVKAALREIKRNKIRMQESAQTVAWLKSHPDTGGLLNTRGRRIHVSQDRHEIWVIIADYDDSYLRYLEGEDDPDAFMTMQEYGPWFTDNLNHMRHLAPILVAIALRAEADLKEEKKKAKKSE
ncbi:hypothetical protein BJX63DRAFT_427265 [Aspergillus granulosus]|uniref:Uncharacterized protein n=1 Tax=Aspergillus granulosus TaxID=176169 RepID=A0ABR4I2C7_9EURO